MQRSPDVQAYVECTTPQQVVDAVAELDNCSCLILDCEGEELGCADGALSLICIGTPSATKIFVFDVVSLTVDGNTEALAPLLRVTSNPNIRKVVWDGRMDDIELFDCDGKGLVNVLDLQITDIYARRHEPDRKRTWPLSRYFARGISVQESPHHYDGIRLVRGMGACLSTNLSMPNAKDPRVQAIFDSGQAQVWMKRPLDCVLIEYATKDIRLINAFYEQFERRRLVTPSSLSMLLPQSTRYVGMYRDLSRFPRTDPFLQNPVLLMAVLDEPIGPLYECLSCKRKLAIACYETRSTSKRNACRSCYVIGVNLGLSDNGWVAY